jgi:hypothetical protein
MSSSVPGQGKVQSDLNASSTGKKADAKPVADTAGTADEFVLYGDHLSDADPLGDVGNSLIEQSVSYYCEKALRLLRIQVICPQRPSPASALEIEFVFIYHSFI